MGGAFGTKGWPEIRVSSLGSGPLIDFGSWPCNSRRGEFLEEINANLAEWVGETRSERESFRGWLGRLVSVLQDCPILRRVLG
jgi:hypothetical protein